jgi:hypothetical protein
MRCSGGNDKICENVFVHIKLGKASVSVGMRDSKLCLDTRLDRGECASVGKENEKTVWVR